MRAMRAIGGESWKTVGLATAAAIALWSKIDLLLIVAGAAILSILVF